VSWWAGASLPDAHTTRLAGAPIEEDTLCSYSQGCLLASTGPSRRVCHLHVGVSHKSDNQSINQSIRVQRANSNKSATRHRCHSPDRDVFQPLQQEAAWLLSAKHRPAACCPGSKSTNQPERLGAAGCKSRIAPFDRPALDKKKHYHSPAPVLLDNVTEDWLFLIINNPGCAGGKKAQPCQAS
jgi:hypothetical protein